MTAPAARFFFTHGTVPVLLKAAAGGGSGPTRLLATMKLQRSVDMCFPSVAERTPSHARKWNNKMHKFSGVWKKELAGLTWQWCDDASTSPFKSAEGRRVKETVKAAAATKKKTQSSLKARLITCWFDLLLRPQEEMWGFYFILFYFFKVRCVSSTAVTSVEIPGHRVQCDEGGWTFSTLNEQRTFL